MARPNGSTADYPTPPYWIYQGATMTDLHDGLTQSLIHAGEQDLDTISAVDVSKVNVIGCADSMAWQFDLKNMWLTKSRWSMMAKQYLDAQELLDWLQLCTGRIGLNQRGIAVLRTKQVKPRGGEVTGHTNKVSRRWGSCMLALSYKALPHPTITLHSRTSYLGYIGALDLTVAWMCGRYLAQAMGVPVETFKFVWMIEQIQWHNFKSLAFMLNHPDEGKRKEYRRLLIKPESKLEQHELDEIHEAPAVMLSRKWLRRVMKLDAEGHTYGDMTYNTYRRIRRRWHTEVLGYERAKDFEGWSYYKKGPNIGEQKEFFKAYAPLPSVTADTLDFSCLGIPLTANYAADFVPGDGLDDLLDEDDE